MTQHQYWELGKVAPLQPKLNKPGRESPSQVDCAQKAPQPCGSGDFCNLPQMPEKVFYPQTDRAFGVALSEGRCQRKVTDLSA
jgi:hypothetical protein